MAKRARPSIFNAGTAINVFSIPLLTIAFWLVGWYFTTGDALKHYATDISNLQAGREQDKKEFGTKFDQMNTSLGALNTHAAVQDEQSKMMNETLKTISSQLQGLRR